MMHIFSVDFALKVLQWSDSEIVRLQLWDIAGRPGRLGENKRKHSSLTSMPLASARKSVKLKGQAFFFFFSEVRMIGLL